MANHSSAKKAIRQTVKKTLINKSRASKIKTFVKKVLKETATGTKQSAQSAFLIAQAETMRGVTKRVLKLNTASRIISKLSSKVKAMKEV